MNKEKVRILKAMLKGLTPEKNFHPMKADESYPHCVIAERHLVAPDANTANLIGIRAARVCMGGDSKVLTHKWALATIRKAIRKWSK